MDRGPKILLYDITNTVNVSTWFLYLCFFKVTVSVNPRLKLAVDLHWQ